MEKPIERINPKTGVCRQVERSKKHIYQHVGGGVFQCVCGRAMQKLKKTKIKNKKQ